MEAATRQAFGTLRAQALESDKNLLSIRESARLFSEEMGLHMPRAVSSAVAKIIPDINLLGGALLGVYAAKELYTGIEKFTDWVRESFVQQTEDVKAFAEAASNAYKTAGTSAEEAFTKFKTSAAGQYEKADVDARVNNLLKIVDAYHELRDKAGDDVRVLGSIDAQAIQVIAAAAKQGITSVEEAEKRLNEAGQLQLEVRRRLEEVRAKEEKEAPKQHTEHVRMSSEAQRWAIEMIRAGQEAGRVAIQLRKDQDEAGASAIRAANAELKFALSLEQLGIVGQLDLSNLRQLAPAIEYQNVAIQKASAVKRAYITVSEQFSAAMHKEKDAISQDYAGAVAGITEGFAALIGGTKAVAYVKGTYDAALAAEYLAQFIASWGTDVAAGLAAAQYGIAAAEMFKAAGRGSGGGAGGSGGGHGGQPSARASNYGGGGAGSETGPSSGSGRGGGSGPGAAIHINNYGPVVTDANSQQQLWDMWSQQAKNGALWTSASTAMIQGPTTTGRG